MTAKQDSMPCVDVDMTPVENGAEAEAGDTKQRGRRRGFGLGPSAALTIVEVESGC